MKKQDIIIHQNSLILCLLQMILRNQEHTPEIMNLTDVDDNKLKTDTLDLIKKLNAQI